MIHLDIPALPLRVCQNASHNTDAEGGLAELWAEKRISDIGCSIGMLLTRMDVHETHSEAFRGRSVWLVSSLHAAAGLGGSTTAAGARVCAAIGSRHVSIGAIHAGHPHAHPHRHAVAHHVRAHGCT